MGSGSPIHLETQWMRRGLAAVFVLLAGMPLALSLTTSATDIAEAEQRKLAPFPQSPAGLAGLQTYPKRFEGWFNDHFGLRSALIQGHSRAKAGLLGVSTNQRVALGRDGWLYYSGVAMDDFRGALRFSPHQLVYWQRFLEGKRDWLAERGVHYLFVVAPNKQSVYPEFVPARHTRPGTPLLDQLIAHLERNSDVEILDLRPALVNAKPAGRLYDKTDSHWNDLGAHVAYSEIIGRLAERFPQLSATPLDRFQVDTTVEPGGNLAKLLNLADVFWEDRVRLAPTAPACAGRTPIELKAGKPWARHARPFTTRCETAADVNAVIFRDSFFTRLAPLMSESFRRADFVWQANANHPLAESAPLMMEMVVRTRPDVVIDEIVERKLIRPIALSPPMLSATARKRFRESETILLNVGTDGRPVPVRAVRQATVTSEPSGTGILTTGKEGLVALPAIQVPDGYWPVVHLRLDSPVRTVMKLLYQTAENPRYQSGQAVYAALEKGANDIYLELPEPGITGSLWLHPGPETGRFTVREIQVRARPAPVPAAPGTGGHKGTIG